MLQSTELLGYYTEAIRQRQVALEQQNELLCAQTPYCQFFKDFDIGTVGFESTGNELRAYSHGTIHGTVQ